METPSGWTKQQMADEIIQMIDDGSSLNLGIGMPTLIAERMPAHKRVFIHSENGVHGVSGRPTRETVSPTLINAGKETISADSPVMLPEAALAIRSGKLPRKAGLTLVRHDQQYDLTLQAETFAVNGAKITQIGNDNAVDGQDRIQQLREFSETMDLLFDVFCERRLGKGWKADLKNIQQWLQTDKPIRRRAAAA